TTAAAAASVPQLPPPARGQSQRLAPTAAPVGRSPSRHSAPGTSPKPGGNGTTLYDRGASSLEQSVKKFRIVEALRKGDTAPISRAIRETAGDGPRASISSAAPPSSSSSSPPALLEDTTILHLAIQCADLPVVEYVLSDGGGGLVDVNARD